MEKISNNNNAKKSKEPENKNYESCCGSSTSKLRALIKKNLLVLKRNKITTLCEIFFPIILMLLMLLVRNSFLILEYDYETQEGTTSNYIDRRSVSYIDFSHPEMLIPDNNTNITNINNEYNRTIVISYINDWYGLNILAPLTICTRYNKRNKERPLIATIGVPDEIKEKIVNDSIIYQSRYGINFSMRNFKDFKDIRQMNHYVEDDKFGTDEMPGICFGIKFEERKDGYNFSLHYFDSLFEQGIQDLSNIIDGPIDLFKSGPDMQSYQRYRNSGYAYIMKCIHEYILQKETKNKNAKLNFGLMPMKYINYKTDKLGPYISFIIPFFIMVAYMCSLCLYVYRMVSEKESRAKEGMKIMGLGEGIYFISFFLQYLVINLVVSIANTIIVKFIFTKIPFYYLFLMFFLWGMNVFALAFFYQSFIDSTRIALILSLLIYFIMYFLSIACIKETSPQGMKIGLSFFPPVALEVTIVMFGEFESHFRTFKPRYFTNIYTNFSIFRMVIMFVIDFFIYTFLGYYLQMVLPHTYGIRKPFYFIFTSEYWCGKTPKYSKLTLTDTASTKSDLSIKAMDQTQNNETLFQNSDINSYYTENSNFESEEIYRDKTKKDDVLKISNIVKTFEDGKTAVNDLNINFYKDEIFALLGHNGAGKTTLISMLTGLYEATQGQAFYDGDDILLGDNMDKFRLKIGICPQHDILFDDLTIKEHLNMFSIFKGFPSEKINEEVERTINDFQLNEIQDMVVEDLSAGQKRQLSIAIALIGGSKIIFLDEPSSGMDISSRRNLWEILKRQSEHKIIILTTHYMEEASVLGNRIGILSEGKMKCIGTPLFLIERFGKFMCINIFKEENANNDDIINYMKSKIKEPQYEILSEEIIIRISKSEYNNGGGLNLKEFFEDLDNNLINLKIKSYRVSMPTLEDVFLNVASEENKRLKNERTSVLTQSMKENQTILFSLDCKEDYSKKSKFCDDFVASFKRRLILIRRDLKSFLMEILCPIALVLIGLSVSQVKFEWSSNPWRMDISYIGKQNVLFSSIQGINNIEDYYFMDKYINVTCQTLPINNFNQEEKKEAIVNFIDRIYEINNMTEDSKLLEVDMNDEDYVGYFGALLMLNEENDNYEFLIAVNSRVKHSVPIYTFYFMKQIIQKAIGHKINIDFTHHPLPLTSEINQRSDQANNSIFILFVATAFSLIPSSFVTMYLRERINNSKHLMRVSGIKRTPYWIVNYIFELIKYYFTCGICIFFIWVFGYYKDYFITLYIFFGPAMVSSTYVLSFLFSKESTAQNAVILLNFVIGALGSVVVLLLRGMDNTYEGAKILQYFLAVMPSFCFNFGYDLLLNKLLIYVIEFPDNWMFLDDDEVIKHFDLILGMIVYLIIEFLVYTGILFIIEINYYKYIIRHNDKLETNVKDRLVLKEIEKANSDEIKIVNEHNADNKSDYSLRLKNIRKVFKKGLCCCCKKRNEIIAIKNLNFCVKPGECFGLLGLNGAGKTSTFKCITQEYSPSNGSIYINGVDTYNNFEQIKSYVGYCPQYDAIFDYLTVYENLEFYARIKGVKLEYLTDIVQAIIKEMSLEEYTNKISGKLSGGNKRKLSVAISLLCNPQIILLDEPSTGMDPEARRFMWAIIHKISKYSEKSSVVMTTHSMDEAETLCKRMGIMVNGEFVCLGKASEIKETYGYGYEVDIRIKPLSKENIDKFIEILNKGTKILNDNAIMSNGMIDHNLNLNSKKNFIYNKRTKINKENIENILIILNKSKFISELKEDRLGKKIIKDIEIKGHISLITLLNWIFFNENAFKFIKNSIDYFDEIFLAENIENNFLFKMKKGPNTKSIGFFFGLFEQEKEKCFVSEYSIQQTSLEQIFNQFAKDQINIKLKEKKKKKPKDEIKDNNNKNEFFVDKELINKIIS